MDERELPRVCLYSPVLWWRYFVRFFSSFVPPSPVKSLLYGLTGIKVDRGVFIGDGVYFVDGFKGALIELRRRAVLSPRAILVAMAVPGESSLAREYCVTKTSKIVVEEDAWIGVGAVILPGVTIGRGAIIGANAVVNQSVGPFEVWAGVPARYIKKVEEYGRRHPQA